MNLSHDIKKIIKADCKARSHIEACGIILKNQRGDINVVPCENCSDTPHLRFVISEDIIDVYIKKGNQLIGYYHSHIHPNSNGFSLIDKVMSETTRLISVLYCLNSDEILIYKPNGWIAPFENRPYMIGFLDSFSILKDFYKNTIDINNNFCYNRYTESIDSISFKNKDLMHKKLLKYKFVLSYTVRENNAVIISSDGLDKEFGVYTNNKILTHFKNQPSQFYSLEELNKMGYNVRFYGYSAIG